MIYPVRIKTWFLNPKSPFHEDLKYLKHKIGNLKCKVCGNKINLEKGYVSHGFAYGYQDDNYCSKKCMATKYKLVGDRIDLGYLVKKAEKYIKSIKNI